MCRMGKSNAQRQTEFQQRQLAAGNHRLDTFISADAHTALKQIAQREGCTRKDAVEQSIFNEAKGRTMTTKPEQPGRPQSMTEEERKDLINWSQDIRAHQFNGGDAGAARKAAFNAALDASNQHRQK